MQMSFGFPEPSYTYYWFIIEPPLEIQRFVTELKWEIGATQLDFESRTTKPHLSIIKYMAAEENERRIFETLKKELLNIGSFKLSVTGIQAFDSSRTIYLATDFPKNLQEVKRIVQVNKKTLRISDQSCQILETPHITVAKNLGRKTFRQAKATLLKKTYERSFHVDGIVVMKSNSLDSKFNVYTKIVLK